MLLSCLKSFTHDLHASLMKTLRPSQTIQEIFRVTKSKSQKPRNYPSKKALKSLWLLTTPLNKSYASTLLNWSSIPGTDTKFYFLPSKLFVYRITFGIQYIILNLLLKQGCITTLFTKQETKDIGRSSYLPTALRKLCCRMGTRNSDSIQFQSNSYFT